MESIIYLFSGKSDASTLVHELAHHLYETLRSMVDFNLASGIAVDEQLLTELDTLEQWAKSQSGDYRENIAQAFEKYVMNGVAPSDKFNIGERNKFRPGTVFEPYQGRKNIR